MSEYVFFYKDIILGGCELLIEKIGRTILEKGSRVRICCKSIDDSMAEKFKKSRIEVHQLFNWNSNKEIISWINEDCEVVTFFWDDFVRLYSLKKNRKKTILYAVHFQTLAIGANCRYFALKNLIKKVAVGCVHKFLLSNNILCMDEQTVRYTQNYFKNKVLDNNSIYRIVRIPIHIENVEEKNLENRAKNPALNILTIARADFPFKGYLLGLINFIEGLKDKSNLHLDIVSYGSDIDRLKKHIDATSEDTKRIISLHGRTDYEELRQYYNKAKLYIGMGTTILDASQQGIISIPVVPYTDELIADKFFHEDYKALAVDDVVTNNMIKLFNYVRSLGYEKYLELSEKTRNEVIENYSVEKTVKDLLNNFEEISYDKFCLSIFIFKRIYTMQYLMQKIKAAMVWIFRRNKRNL